VSGETLLQPPRSDAPLTELRLQSIDDLFRAPNISPLSDDFPIYNSSPGIDYLARELAGRRTPKILFLKLLLPAAQITPDLETQASTAITRYCDSRIADIENDLRLLWEQVRQTLLWAIPGWFVLLGLAHFLSKIPDPEFDIIAQGLSVLAWVLLWFPLDTMIFGIRQRRAERDRYRLIRETHLQLLPAEEA
jgi:hypothetical protein